MKKTQIIALLVLLITVACSPALASTVEFSPTPGGRAPLFELQALFGETVSLDDYKGQVVLLNFWATWCGPCRLEMPTLQDRFENTDLQILAINLDEPFSLVHPYVEELGLTFTILMDPGAKTQDLYQVRGYPTSFIVDEEGVIQFQHIGFMDETTLDGYLQSVGIIN